MYKSPFLELDNRQFFQVAYKFIFRNNNNIGGLINTREQLVNPAPSQGLDL